MLYLVATPIGNLSDISFRAIEILRSCDYILCEDTRTSLVLLQKYDIRKPLKSYHKFNETGRAEEVLEDLKKDLNIALISDAGTPGISDPGEKLVAQCRAEGLPVSAIPGPCAAIMALSLSGLNSERFQFIGFLPKKASELKAAMQEILQYTGTSICYESPHRIEDTLALLSTMAKDRRLAIARELTKIYEECLLGTASQLSDLFAQKPPKGEIVLLISGQTAPIDYTHMSPQEHVACLQEQYGLTKQEAIKMAASLRNVPKRTIYNELQGL
jgi:16S rRNA (cytidine1402-2'-O)-methyltransferase